MNPILFKRGVGWIFKCPVCNLPPVVSSDKKYLNNLRDTHMKPHIERAEEQVDLDREHFKEWQKKNR